MAMTRDSNEFDEAGDAAIDLLSERLLQPDVIEAADRALRGELILPGTHAEPRFVGDPPDWFANPVGDPEYTWTLNRLEHWPTLIRAWLATGDAAYADRVVLELRDWLARCVCPPIDPAQAGQKFHDGLSMGRRRALGQKLKRWPIVYRTVQQARRALRPSARQRNAIPLGETPYNTMPWRTLEAGVRMVYIWPMLAKYLPAIAPDDDALRAEFERVGAQHAEVLATLSPLLWPDADNNHYLMECLGLLRAALLFPDALEAAAWRDQAIAEIDRCAAVQFAKDGGHVEGCPHYHNVCTLLLAKASYFAQQAGLRLADATETKLIRAIDYCLHTLRPTGVGVPVGDSDADQLAVPATLFGYLATGDAEPLRAVVQLAGEEALRAAFIEYFDVIDDPAAILDACAGDAEIAAPLLGWQRQTDQVAMRTGWDRDALSVFFHCHTPVFNGHAHADPASFEFTALGQTLLADAGRFSYVDNADRRAVKSAAWHNTITVDGREPFAYLSSMQHAPQRPGRIARVYRGPRFMAAESRHENYHPAVHRRLVALVDDACLVVIDRLTGLRPRSTAQLYFHLGSDEATLDAAGRSATAKVGDVGVLLYVSDNLRGQTLPGWISPRLDARTDTCRLRFDDRPGNADRCYATVIVPRRLDEPAPRVGDLIVQGDGHLARVGFTLDDQPISLEWSADDGAADGTLRVV